MRARKERHHQTHAVAQCSRGGVEWGSHAVLLESLNDRKHPTKFSAMYGDDLEDLVAEYQPLNAMPANRSHQRETVKEGVSRGRTSE